MTVEWLHHSSTFGRTKFPTTENHLFIGIIFALSHIRCGHLRKLLNFTRCFYHYHNFTSSVMEEKEYTTGSDGIKIIRKRTEAETQVHKRKIAGTSKFRYRSISPAINHHQPFRFAYTYMHHIILPNIAHEFISHLPKESQLPEANPYIPQLLSGAIFCGHLVITSSNHFPHQRQFYLSSTLSKLSFNLGI